MQFHKHILIYCSSERTRFSTPFLVALQILLFSMTKMSRLRRRGRRRRGPVPFLLLEDGDVLGPELGHRPVEVEHLDPGAPGGGRGEGHRQLVRVAAVSHAHSLHF